MKTSTSDDDDSFVMSGYPSRRELRERGLESVTPRVCSHLHVTFVGRDTSERNLFRCVKCSTIFQYAELPAGVMFDD